MARIHTLPAHEAHKIAAGEVVERPVSVIKELLENAIDAGADNIQLIVTDGGRSRMQIIDNGHGMDRDDMYACIKEHATSKITSCSEVPTITSFGFRGEALSSISTVSTLTITSQESESHEGYTITVRDGTVVDEQMTARAPGTEIIVDDLFYNVPARKKFLKKRETEWRAIYQLCVAFALSAPHCAFTLTHDNRHILRCTRAQSHSQRISQVYDSYFAHQFITCEHTDEQHNIHVSGLITHPEYHRYDRTMLTCFVNNRWVKNHRLAQAIIKGYADILPPRRFPAGYVFITVPPEEVDINVHPRKEEVHFLHPRRVERIIEQAVRATLEEHVRQNVTIQPSPQRTGPSHATAATTTSSPASQTPFRQRSTEPGAATPIDTYPSHHVVTTSRTTEQQQEAMAPHAPSHAHNNAASYDTPERESAQSHHGPTHEPHHTPSTTDTNVGGTQSHIPQTSGHNETSETVSHRVLGQVMQTYIILERDNSCVMIDQHAAHERILYETFMHNTHVATTRLIFPQRVTLSQSDCDHLMAHAQQLHAYGIELDRFDPTNIVITAVPVALKTVDWSDMLSHLVSILPYADEADRTTDASYMYHDVCATMACKAAIKAGDTLSDAEMHELVTKLESCPHRMTCPHGRPTTITFSRNDLERKFKRSV